ncbi:acyl carrier protein [Nocardioides sp. AE5]|uniref:acyl carrier protein n=1 Tax=Nocardioides sp. AE5 TaxID=2962573 RepID=UPI0028823B22|nr:acyl carrier protein [Nocardioides sp. AE5]MDT0202576.1 acyl carrier protein [Nocardioides sp. AE5]
MAIAAADVEKVVREFVARAKEDAPAFDNDTPLYADGVGLDSLETAELSAVLEDEFDTDPFSADEMPQTLGEILAFYAGETAAAGA